MLNVGEILRSIKSIFVLQTCVYDFRIPSKFLDKAEPRRWTGNGALLDSNIFRCTELNYVTSISYCTANLIKSFKGSQLMENFMLRKALLAKIRNSFQESLWSHTKEDCRQYDVVSIRAFSQNPNYLWPETLGGTLYLNHYLKWIPDTVKSVA